MAVATGRRGSARPPRYGYHGRILAVDLATGRTGVHRADPEADRADGAGPVRALRYLAEAVAAGHREPDDPAVPVVLTLSAVAGLPAPGLARCAVVGLSPLSGGVAETRAEGPFAAALSGAGVDAVVLTGRAGHPVYLVVSGGTATVRDAGALWGLSTGAATDLLAARHGGAAGVAVIGPAGERRVRYASIVTARHFPLPRLGFGAVFGARNLKAVVCLGADRPPVADPDAVRELTDWYAVRQPDNPLTAWQHEPPGFGTWPGTLTDPGHCAVRNFSDTATLPVAGLRPDRFTRRLTVSAGGCPGCPTDCVKIFATPGIEARPAGLHQEAVAALGPNLGIDDADTVLAANSRCAQLGLDPVSVGGTLGCLFEAAEAGLLPPDRALPAPARFGATASLPPLIDAIGTGTGAGPVVTALAQGAARLADRLGTPRLAMTVRSVELPPFDPRIQPGLALAYAVAPIGPRYDSCEHDLDFDPVDGAPHCYPELRRLGLRVPQPAARLDADRAERTAVLMRLWSALDALLICPFASTPTRPLSMAGILELVRAVTGWELSRDELLRLGGDRLRVQDELNVALGIGPDADRLPGRMHTEPVAAGRHAGAVLDPVAFDAATRRLRHRLGLATPDGSSERGCESPAGRRPRESEPPGEAPTHRGGSDG